MRFWALQDSLYYIVKKVNVNGRFYSYICQNSIWAMILLQIGVGNLFPVKGQFSFNGILVPHVSH